MPSARMAGIESHLARRALPIWMPGTAFAGLALFNYNGYPEVCSLHHLPKVTVKTIITCLRPPSGAGFLGGEGERPGSFLDAID